MWLQIQSRKYKVKLELHLHLLQLNSLSLSFLAAYIITTTDFKRECVCRKRFYWCLASYFLFFKGLSATPDISLQFARQDNM